MALNSEVVENVLLGLASVIAVTIVVVTSNDGLAAVYLSVCVSLCWLLKVALGKHLAFRFLTLPSFFFASYLVLMPPGAFIVHSQMTGDIRHVYLLAVLSVMVTFPTGVGIATLTWSRSSKGSHWFPTERVSGLKSDKRFSQIAVAMLVVSGLALATYFGSADQVQLADFITGRSIDVTALDFRFAGSDDVSRSVQFAFELTRRCLLPICALYFYFMASIYGGLWRVTFLLTFIAGLFVSALTLDRAPPLAYVVMLVLAGAVGRGESIPARLTGPRGVLLCLAALSTGGLVSAIQYNADFEISKAVADTWYVLSYRILQDAPYMASVAFETFSDETTFLRGEYVRLLSVFPGFQYVASVGETIHSPAAPVGFVADLWRNFGWAGVIIGTTLLGYVLQSIQMLAFKRKTVVTSASYVVVLVGSVWVIHGNLLGVMSTSMIAFGALCALLAPKDDSAAAPRGVLGKLYVKRIWF